MSLLGKASEMQGGISEAGTFWPKKKALDQRQQVQARRREKFSDPIQAKENTGDGINKENKGGRRRQQNGRRVLN